MSAFEAITHVQGELTAIRQDIHAHPEIGMEEHRTADIVAQKLEEWGIEVHRGVGGTGVVGVLRPGNGQRAIGLRADMDALPMQEATDAALPAAPPGGMHACGHDGHTTMLLGAARYLAETRALQRHRELHLPARRGRLRRRAGHAEGRAVRALPLQPVFAMHNRPGLPVGQFAIRRGPTAAGGAFFDITVHRQGRAWRAAGGEHRPGAGGLPHHRGAADHRLPQRRRRRDTAVVSVTKISGGDAYNVIPQTA